jgi:hypothetical protein
MFVAEPSRQPRGARPFLAAMLCCVLCACGGGSGGSATPPPPAAGALLYVTNESAGTLDVLTIDARTGIPTPLAGSTRVIALDPATGYLTLSSQVDTNWSSNVAFNVGDVLGTGLDQMLIGTANLYTNYFTVYDFTANLEKWTSATTTGGGQAIVHADLNGDGIDDLVGVTSDGYIFVYDVAHQTLLWSSTGLGSATDVAVADLDGDGIPEIIVASGNGVIVYKKSGSTYLQSTTYAVSGSKLLVADTDGDGKPEVYVLGSSGAYPYTTTIYQLDNTLTLLHSYPVANATSMTLEASAYTRKNLIVGVTGSCCVSPTTASQVQIIDPSSGTLIWQSPALLGEVAKNSLEFLDLSATGQLQMSLGTTWGMYLTQ